MWATSLVWLFLAQTYIIPGRPPAAPPAGCNEFVETTWDDLTSFSEGSDDGWVVDATNDELDNDKSDANREDWLIHTTDTTDGDHCCLFQLTVMNAQWNQGCILRGQSGTGNVYVAGAGDGSGTWYWSLYSTSATDISWSADIATSSQTGYSSGNWMGACVTGTGDATVWQMWRFTSAPSGNCRSDWGTANWTSTTNPGGSADDSGTRVGMMIEAGNNATLATYDAFAGSDAD